MGAPDLTEYIDLKFFDKDPQDVFDAALLDLQTKLPDWTPREGNVEVLLLESLALQVAEAIFAVNRLPGAVVMALMKLYGIEPDSGAQPTVMMKFEVYDSLGHDIPAGTAARLDLPGGLEPVVFETTEALTIPAGSNFNSVLAVGDRFTVEANGTATGTRLELVDSIDFVDRVETSNVVEFGLDPETDEEWIERAVQRLARLSETLVLPKHFEAYALENPAVLRAKAFDNWDGSGGVPGDNPGNVTVAIYGDGGPVDSPVQDVLLAELDSLAQANLQVNLTNPSVTAVNVTVQVRRAEGYDDATVAANVTAALQGFLSTETWDWSGTVRRNELVHVISNAEGVDYVDSLTTPAADQVLPGTAALAEAGTITVTTIA